MNESYQHKELAPFTEEQDDEFPGAKVQLLRTDDWIGIYIRGELCYEGHSIAPDRLLELAGHPVEVKWIEDNAQWDEWGGHCPKEWLANV